VSLPIRIAQAQREQVRTALVSAALDLFRRQGFAATTVEAVAAAAGVAKGTFYNYFATKEDVALAAIVPVLEEAAAAFSAAPPDLAARLDGLLGHLASRLAGSPELVWVWASELMRRGKDHPGAALFHDLLTDLFAAAQRAGQARADRSPEHLALGLEGSLHAHVAHWHYAGAQAPLGPLLREAAATYLGGAAARPAPRTE
jgi:AcrR family transcriptional regulator